MEHEFSIMLYLFSSFIQADAAILAVIGVFVIFRLQSTKAWTDETYQKVILRCQTGISILNRSRAQYIEFSRQLELNQSEPDQIDMLEKGLAIEPGWTSLRNLISVLRSVKIIKNDLKSTLIYFSIHICLNSLFLVFAQSIWNCGSLFVYSSCLLSITIFVVLILFIYDFTVKVLSASSEHIVKQRAKKEKIPSP
jgi:hypothetical protein